MPRISPEQEVTVTSGEWTLVSSPESRKKIRNLQSIPVGIVELRSETAVPEDESSFLVLGGRYTNFLSQPDVWVWAKSVDTENRDGVLLVRDIDQTADLPEELINLSNDFEILKQEFLTHRTNKENPHDVDKDQINLDDIPNDISDDPESDSSTTLATTKLTHIIKEKADEHYGRDDNPHSVSKAQVGLGDVNNYGVATYDEAMDHGCDIKYTTPRRVHDVMDRRIMEFTINPLLPVMPQCVIDGIVGEFDVALDTLPDSDRNTDWGAFGVGRVPKTVTQLSQSQLRVNPGLRISYAYNTEICVSHALEEGVDVSVPVDDPNMTGMNYLFAEIGEDQYFSDFYFLKYPTRRSPYRVFSDYPGDTWCTADMTVLSNSGQKVRRVPIAMVYVTQVLQGENVVNAITSIQPVPVGEKYTQVIGVEPGDRFLNSVYQDNDASVDVRILYNGIVTPAGFHNHCGVYSDHFFHPSAGMYRTLIRVGTGGVFEADGPHNLDLDTTNSPVYKKVTAFITFQRKF